MKPTNVIIVSFVAILAMMLVAVAPVAAAWNGENWVAEDHNVGCDKVVYDAWSGNTNCYRDVNPSIALQNSIDTHQGTVKFIIRAGYSTLSPSVSISNDLSKDSNESVSVDILPDGEVEYQLAAGNYTAVLDNFNLPDETAHFVIVPGKESFVPFVGQAASPAPKVEPTATPTVCPTPVCTGKFVFVNLIGIIKMNNELRHDRTFNFDNRPNPGGIWSSNGNLVQQINDPVYGIVKDVYILYSHKETVRSSRGQHTVITMRIGHWDEYQNIGLTRDDTVVVAIYGDRACTQQNQPRVT